MRIVLGDKQHSLSNAANFYYSKTMNKFKSYGEKRPDLTDLMSRFVAPRDPRGVTIWWDTEGELRNDHDAARKIELVTEADVIALRSGLISELKL